MNFAPKDLSVKLTKLGCVAELGMGYDPQSGYPLCEFGNDYFYFIYQDFIGPSEQAKKNAEIIWPDVPRLANKARTMRAVAIDLDGDQFWPAIEKAVDERLK